MLNKIWGAFIIVGILFAIITNNIESINNEIIESPKTALDLFLTMFPLMVLWSGIMNIAADAGILNNISKAVRPLFKKIFPELKSDHPALGYIASNLVINMMGIHNASTPFGLKAMKCMQEDNKDKKVATRSMITFLVFNTSGVTLIATDILAVRGMYGSMTPTLLLLPTLIVTLINTSLGLLMDNFLYKVTRKKYEHH